MGPNNLRSFLEYPQYELSLYFRYAACIAHILTNTSSDARSCIQERARDSVNRFSAKQFDIGWIRTMESLINSAKK